MKRQFNFIDKRKLWYTLSILVIFIGIAAMIKNQLSTGQMLNWGADFTGGTNIIVRLTEKLPAIQKDANQKNKILGEVRTAISNGGFKKASISYFDKFDIIIRTPVLSVIERQELVKTIQSNFGTTEVLSIDSIGPTIGKELRTQALLIMAIASVLLLIYITFRFEFWFGVAAIIATVHDALVAISVAAVVGIEINTAFVAAILTILGYSINDTIVIFDRIRDNLKTMHEEKSLAEIANISINQTLTRSINTGLSVLFTLASIMIFGGASLKEFAFIMLVGISSGAYSSIFNAGPLLVDFKRYFAVSTPKPTLNSNGTITPITSPAPASMPKKQTALPIATKAEDTVPKKKNAKNKK